MVMTKVGIAQLKAHLSQYVRGARRGETVVVLDRNEPVARLVPYESANLPLPTRKPLRGLHDLRLLPPVAPSPDSLAALAEERRDRR